MRAEEVDATEEQARAIEAHAEQVARTVYARVYRDPFWDARFGKRGHYHTERDGNYHLSYLAQAVRARAPKVMAEYALWARGMLVPRGMCSHHLAENFGMIRDALAEQGIAGDAAAILDAAALALTYTDGPSGALDRIAEGAVGTLAVQGGTSSTARDWRHHLSYLADAVALGRPELFSDYLAFLDRWQAEALPSAALRAQLAAVLGERLPAPALESVRPYLTAG